MTAEEIEQLRYQHPRLLASGEWAALQHMFFTVGLFVGLDETGYRTRFCFEHYADARMALESWDGHGDPPGPWIKEKGAPGGDRRNPATFKGLPIVEEAAPIDPKAWERL
jgi:hypothetical protein